MQKAVKLLRKAYISHTASQKAGFVGDLATWMTSIIILYSFSLTTSWMRNPLKLKDAVYDMLEYRFHSDLLLKKQKQAFIHYSEPRWILAH